MFGGFGRILQAAVSRPLPILFLYEPRGPSVHQKDMSLSWFVITYKKLKFSSSIANVIEAIRDSPGSRGIAIMLNTLVSEGLKVKSACHIIDAMWPVGDSSVEDSVEVAESRNLRLWICDDGSLVSSVTSVACNVMGRRPPSKTILTSDNLRGAAC